jgi:DNA-directed RNA polymerase specialized sigma24 family protein
MAVIEAGAGEAAPSDAEVVRRVLAGERALFEVLMRRYNQRVYRAIRCILRDEQEAEDAMQQTPSDGRGLQVGSTERGFLYATSWPNLWVNPCRRLSPSSRRAATELSRR